MKLSLLLVSFVSTFSYTLSYFDIGDNAYGSCPTPKTGVCPPTAVNPSIYSCTDNNQCVGFRLCCPSNGNKFCSDPIGFKSSARCPKYIENKDVPCYSDFNCNFGPGSTPQTCCFDESTCASYCAEDPANDSVSALNQLKNETNCPITLKNSNQDCLQHADCPRNQICCLNGRSGKSCSDPRNLISGSCPTPTRLAGGAPCAADVDCNLQSFTGKKCCRLDDAHYRCAYPEINDDDVTTRTSLTTPTPTSNVITAIPPTNLPVSLVCPSKNKKCPFVGFGGSSVCRNDSQCSPSEVCCRSFFLPLRKVCVKPAGTKPGICPPSDELVGTSNECVSDINCRGIKKCCGVDGCTAYNCVTPILLDEE